MGRMSILSRISRTEYVRTAMEERADLTAFKERPGPRIYFGLFLMAFSYLIGWPAVGAMGALALYLKEPLILAVGGPLFYGLSHLVFILGMYLAGAKYARIFLRWATRKAMEKLMGEATVAHSEANAEKEQP